MYNNDTQYTIYDNLNKLQEQVKQTDSSVYSIETSVLDTNVNDTQYRQTRPHCIS